MSLLDQAAAWLYSVNPTLCKVPPRAADDEYCYMGPDGGEEGALLCGDILYSHATCVGSWLLPPEHHIVEGIVVTALALLAMKATIPKLYQVTDMQHLQIQHPPGASGASLFCVSLILCYKYFGYPARTYYMVMPCNMQWVLSFIQCFVVPESCKVAQYTLLQLRLTFIMSVIIAIVTPETEDCILPFEYEFYWINHFLLLLLPAAYVANGSVSCLPPKATTSNSNNSSEAVSTWAFNYYWWQFSCLMFCLFYFIPVTFLAIYSGLNLNFMLHPPHDHFALKGRWFRLVATLLLALLFGVSRLLVLGGEKMFPKQPKDNSKKNS